MDKLDLEFIENLWLSEHQNFGDVDKILKEVKEKAKELLNKKEELKLLMSCLDATILSSTTSHSILENFAAEAAQPVEMIPELKCAAVCVYPYFVPFIAKSLKQKNREIKIASVAGAFPNALSPGNVRASEAENAIADGATEIDTVVNRSLALQDRWEEFSEELSKVAKAVKVNPNISLKVIISAKELETPKRVFYASFIAMFLGADIVKTSTGKEGDVAQLEDVYYMCKAIKMYNKAKNRKVGIKVSGGIRTSSDAMPYRVLVEHELGKDWLNPSAFRIGATSLMKNLADQLK